MLKNILVNYLGKFWTLLSGFIFIPLYIKLLGFESYSIISFMLVISSLMMVLDAGLTASLSREFSRIDINLSEKVNVYRTFETIYLFILLIIFLSIFGLSNFLAENFFKSISFSKTEISSFLKILSIDISCQMIFKFYLGGLIGLEKHIHSNILQISWSIIRNAFVVILIMFYPNLNLFFYWQAISTVIFTIIVKILLEKSLLNKSKFKFLFFIDKVALVRVKSFALGMFFISLIAAINTQLDKIMISKYLPIQVLGNYNLGVSLSMGVIAIISPVSVAILPRFTKLFSIKNLREFKNLFDIVNGITTIVIFSIMALLFFCAKGILFSWTGSDKMAIDAHGFLMVLAIGNSMVALQIIPYCVAVANGNTFANNVLGLCSVFLTIPGYWYTTKYYGAIGVAIFYSSLQIIITIIYIYYINKNYLQFSNFKLFGIRFLFPLFISLFFAYIFSFFKIYNNYNNFLLILFYLFSFIFIISINLFFFFRNQIHSYFRK